MMPPPSAPQLEPSVKAALADADIAGSQASSLGEALSAILAHALQLFASQAQVLPGIPAAAPPPPGAGVTVAPGSLMPPPAGGPGESTIAAIANSEFSKQQIVGKHAGHLADYVAALTAQALTLFTAQVKVAPGIPIAGFATAAPGQLLGAASPGARQLETVGDLLRAKHELAGKAARDLNRAVASAIASALSSFASQMLVAPAIPTSPAATVGPGRLM